MSSSDTNPRHFLTLMDFTPIELTQLIARAIEMKKHYKSGDLAKRQPMWVMVIICATRG